MLIERLKLPSFQFKGKQSKSTAVLVIMNNRVTVLTASVRTENFVIRRIRREMT